MWALLAGTAASLVALVRWRRSGLSWYDYLGLSIIWAYARLWHGCRSNGPLPLPAKGAALLVVNHTCSADPAFLQTWARRVLSYVMERSFYDDLKPLRPVFDYIGCVLVCRNGRDIAGARAALRGLYEGRVLCIFPEGGLSGAGRGGVRRGRCGVAWLALRSRAPVYPVFIAEGPQHHSVPRAWLRPSRVRLVCGPALDLSHYLDRPICRPLLEEVTRFIMAQIIALEPNRRNSHERDGSGADAETLCAV